MPCSRCCLGWVWGCCPAPPVSGQILVTTRHKISLSGQGGGEHSQELHKTHKLLPSARNQNRINCLSQYHLLWVNLHLISYLQCRLTPSGSPVVSLSRLDCIRSLHQFCNVYFTHETCRRKRVSRLTSVKNKIPNSLTISMIFDHGQTKSLLHWWWSLGNESSPEVHLKDWLLIYFRHYIPLVP